LNARGPRIDRCDAHDWLETLALGFYSCEGTENPPHFKLTQALPNREAFYLPTERNIVQAHLNSFQSYFSSRLQIARTADGRGCTFQSCWVTKHEGEVCCDGSALSQEWIVSLPVMLVVQANGDHRDFPAGDPWDFPETLYPLGNEKKWKYKLVARAFSLHGNHFVLSFADPKGDVYYYDGLLHNGKCTKLGGTVQNMLCGPDLTLGSRPPNARTEAVVYILEGGLEAKRAFDLEQQSKLAIHHQIKLAKASQGWPVASYTNPDVRLLRPHQIFWAQKNRNYHDRILEYVRKGTPDDYVMNTSKAIIRGDRNAVSFEDSDDEAGHGVLVLANPAHTSKDRHKPDASIGDPGPSSPLTSLPPSPGHKNNEEEPLGDMVNRSILEAYLPQGNLHHGNDGTYRMNCRCLRDGNGNCCEDWIVCCQKCKKWSHLACYPGVGGLERDFVHFRCSQCWVPRRDLREKHSLWVSLSYKLETDLQAMYSFARRQAQTLSLVERLL
jgi:hypothetical protein